MDLNLQQWDSNIYAQFLKDLKSLADEDYRKFHSGLVPGKDNILGIRMPTLRKIGKEISKGNWQSYLSVCQSDYYEEVMIQGIVIGLSHARYGILTDLIDQFIPLIDNWAICDCFCSGLVLPDYYREDFFDQIDSYLASENPWAIRVGLVLMLSHFMDDAHIRKVIGRCDLITSKEYYVQMAQAWLLSISYVKYPVITEQYLVYDCHLDDFTYRKTIQKACESRRLSKEEKQHLKELNRIMS